MVAIVVWFVLMVVAVVLLMLNYSRNKDYVSIGPLFWTGQGFAYASVVVALVFL